MKKTPIQTSIDNVSLNARHFASKTEEEAIKSMKADGLATTDAWAKKAYKACVEDVKKADAQPVQKEKAA